MNCNKKRCGENVRVYHFLHQSVFTLKNAPVDPDSTQPYLILVCLAKSSADSIGDSIRSTVKKAAKLAVYEEIIIKVKNHHIPATIRVDMALKTDKNR